MVQIVDVLNSMQSAFHNHGTQMQKFHSIHDHVFGLNILIDFISSISFKPIIFALNKKN